MSQVRKAVIFAAGLGSRLGSHTKDLPKTLLKVGQLTIFDRIVIGLDKIGVEDMTVVTGYFGSKLCSHTLSFSKSLVSDKVKFNFIENSNLDIGNVYSLWLARSMMTEDFILLNSDVVFHNGILELLVNDNSKTALMIDDSKTLGAEEMKVKVDISHDGRRIIKDITKKMDPGSAYGEYIGITKVSHDDVPTILEKTEKMLSERNFPLYYEDAFRAVSQEHNCFAASSTKGLPWTEIDTIDDMFYARDVILPKLDHAKAPPAGVSRNRI